MQPAHITSIGPSRELCGTTPEQFGDLLVRLAPLAEERRRRHADRPGRKRAPGAGRRPNPFWFRLLVALTHLRQGSSVRASAAIFGIHERSVRRYRDEVEELLVSHGFQPPSAPRPIRTLADLRDYVEGLPDGEVILDATEVRRSSPGPWEAQKQAYSGKTKDHVVKGTVVADRTRRPIWFEANPSGEGRTYDLTMLRSQGELLSTLVALAAAGILVLADRGYPGLDKDLGWGALIPIRKPRGQPLSGEARLFNRALSSLRMPVEHATGRMKWWGALNYWRRSPDRFDRTGKAIGVLTSLT